MIHFALGFISGILLTISLLMLVLFKMKKIEKVIEDIYEKGIQLRSDAVFLEPTTEQAEAIAEVIQENDARGIDTEIKEL